MTPHEFLDLVMAYIAAVGGRVTSYGRDPQNNLAVGGVAHSAHVVWMAADVVYLAPRPLQERKEWAERLGLHLIAEDDHDHLEPASWRPG
jgi:hypothetical protein